MTGFIVPTGHVIREYLEARQISQKELSRRIDTSERHLSKMLNGKTRLTEEMALKLEKIIPDIPADYWLNHESRYREYLAREKEKADIENLDLSLIAKRFHFKEVFGTTDLSLVEQAISMLKLLGVSSFSHYENAIPAQSVAFMGDGGDSEAIVVWLRLCEEEAEDQNKNLDATYSKEKLEQNLKNLKMIALNSNCLASLNSCRKLFNQIGIYFVIQPAIVNSKIRGAIDTIKGKPAIFISGRYKVHDNIWFAIIHEVAHLLLHYNYKSNTIFVDNEDSEVDIETEANIFARNFFLEPEIYRDFTENRNVHDDGEILRFAKEQSVTPGIIVGFLEFDGLLPFGEKSHLKTRV